MTATNEASTSNGSVYDTYAPELFVRGLHPLPIVPGTKKPGFHIGNREYALMANWTTRPVVTEPQPDAGIGLLCGGGIAAVDVDTENVAMQNAVLDAVRPEPRATACKIGKRGFTPFFRAQPDLPSKDFKIDGKTVVQLLSNGRQTVLPPTIHPDTQMPYVWEGDWTLYNIDPTELPELPGNVVERIEAALRPFGYEREEPLPRVAEDSPFQRLNRAAQDRIEDWVPALPLYGLARCRGRYPNYEAVATWRPSSTGRPTEQRKRNLKISRKAIYDFGVSHAYSPIDLVMAAFGVDFDRAFSWLDEKIGWSSGGPEIVLDAIRPKTEPPRDDAQQEAPKQPHYRFKLVPFSEMRPGPEPLYLIDELIPVAGLVDIWGPPKCFKSFVTLDMMFHVASKREYRDRCVRGGAVVYCAFEGAHGYKKRIEAIRRHYGLEGDLDVPLYIMPGQANLIAEHKLLIRDIQGQLGDVKPAAVVLDTLNKSLHGSESKDVDMGAYVKASEAIRDAFGCVVIIVHHCGLDETRPRGHTSLPGAVDAQLAVVREGNTVTMTVEMMRDGPEETVVASMVEVMEVGEDESGKTLTSLVVKPSDAPVGGTTAARWTSSLALFRRALCDALLDSNEKLNIGTNIPAHVVDMEAVRPKFYAIYLPKGDNPEQQQDSRKHAFRRAVEKAQLASLIGVRVEPGGRTLLWLTAPEPIA